MLKKFGIRIAYQKNMLTICLRALVSACLLTFTLVGLLCKKYTVLTAVYDFLVTSLAHAAYASVVASTKKAVIWGVS